MSSWQLQPQGKSDMGRFLQSPRTELYNVSKTVGKQAEPVKMEGSFTS